MDRPDCQECEGIALEQQIRSPAELKQALRVLQGEIQRSVLEQLIVPASDGLEQPSVHDLLSEPNPDIFCSHFRCRHCGQQFELMCETYHGSGGRWSVVAGGA